MHGVTNYYLDILDAQDAPAFRIWCLDTNGALADSALNARFGVGGLRAAAVLYGLPVALFFLGYGLGKALWELGAAVGCGAFLLGLAGAVCYDRLVERKKKTVYTITGFAGDDRLNSMNKGDNDLDEKYDRLWPRGGDR